MRALFECIGAAPMNGFDLFIVGTVLITIWLGQRWLDRRVQRISARKKRYDEACERLIRAIEEMRNEEVHHTPPCCVSGYAVAVAVAHQELADAARATKAFVPEFALREAFDRMVPVNDACERPF
jgi:hypothetical protein